MRKNIDIIAELINIKITINSIHQNVNALYNHVLSVQQEKSALLVGVLYKNDPIDVHLETISNLNKISNFLRSLGYIPYVLLNIDIWNPPVYTTIHLNIVGTSTKNNIIDKIENILYKNNISSMFIYFIGNGMTLEKTEHRSVFIPASDKLGLLSSDMIHETIEKNNVHTTKVFVLLDCIRPITCDNLVNIGLSEFPTSSSLIIYMSVHFGLKCTISSNLTTAFIDNYFPMIYIDNFEERIQFQLGCLVPIVFMSGSKLCAIIL